MTIHYNKLIRDNTPDIAARSGNKVQVRRASTDQEYWHLLKMKLQEEVSELADKPTMEQMADIYEIADAIIDFLGYDWRELGAVKENMVIGKGKYTKRLVLEKSDIEIGSTNDNYI